MTRVLIVDDQPTFRQHLSRLLQRADMDVVAEAETIAQAEEQITLHDPDLALVDLMLPDVDGIEGTSRLTALRPRLRVILISVVTEQREAMRAAALGAGAEDFLPKDELSLELVRSWMSQASSPEAADRER